MAEEREYPVFLSGKPDGVDSFDGQSQERVAFALSELVRKDRISKKVIGLEGEWGSGKSNVVEMVRKKLGKDYYCFIYDAWGNQEDLTRRTFLEEIIEELFEKGFLTGTEKWNKKKNELLARKKSTFKQIIPKVKSFWIFFVVGIISFGFCIGFYDLVLKDWDSITTIDFKLWKPIISVYSIPVIFFGFGLELARRDFSKLWKANKTKKKIEKESWVQILGKMFYWLSGDQVESEEFENVIESEPTVRQFRDYFDDIQKEISEKSKGLIIIFDNIDRLDNEKVKALWSSIHTFFAETSYANTWVIVPYYKEKLAEIFSENNDLKSANGNGFIDKTFSVNFRVAPPVVSDWEKFMRDKIDEAFGPNQFVDDSEEKEYLLKLFDRLSPSATMKPRDMINYINQIVALYHQWKKEVESGEIKLRYLALYSLVKDEILKSPFDKILNIDTVLGTSKSLFTDDDNLEDCISALVFNVAKDKAGEVLLKRVLTQAVRSGNIKPIEDSLSHKAFSKYFRDAFEGVSYEDKKQNLKKIINTISETLPKRIVRGYWKEFSINYEIGTELNADVKSILININDQARLALLGRFNHFLTIDLAPLESQELYYKRLTELKEFFVEKEIKLDFTKVLNPHEINPTLFVQIVNNEGAKYKNLKISCAPELLHDFFYENGVIDVNIVESNIEILKILKEDYDIDHLEEGLIGYMSTVVRTEHELITKCLAVLDTVGNPPIKIKLSTDFYSQLTPPNVHESIFKRSLSIALSDFDSAFQHGSFQTTIQSIDETMQIGISEIVENYITYDELIRLVVENANARIPSVKGVIKNLTTVGDINISIPYALTNFALIQEHVFNNDIEISRVFVQKLNKHKEDYSGQEGFSAIQAEFFSYTDETELELIELIVNNAKTHVTNLLSKDQIITALSEVNRDTMILLSLLKNNQLSTFTDSYYIAFEEYIEALMDNVYTLPYEESLANLLYNKLDGRKLKGIYSRLKDKLLEDPTKFSSEKLVYIMQGLIDHGRLGHDPEKVTYKLFDYIFDDEIMINQVFEPYSDFFIGAISNSGEYIEDAKTKISTNIAMIKGEEVKQNLINEFELDMKSDSEEDNNEKSEAN